jgi:hypothetical protein
MSNDVKWTDWRSSEIDVPQSAGIAGTATRPASAVSQLLGCVVGLIGLSVVLPGPASWTRLLIEVPTRTTGLVSVGAAAEAAILVIAAALTWALLIWVLAVWIAAVAGRLPGAPGRCGRAVVRRIAPSAAGRIVAAAVGVSVLAGTSACAVPEIADLGSDASTEVVSTSSTASTPASLGGGAGVVGSATTAPATAPSTPVNASDLADVLSSITIDWPAVAAPTSTVDSAAPTDQSPQLDSSPPAENSPPVATTGPADAALPTDVVPLTPLAPDSAGRAPDTASAAGSANTEGSAAAQASNAGPTATSPIAPSPPPAVADQVPAYPGQPAGPDVAEPAAVPAAPAAAASRPADADSAAVTVLPGDTLWSVAQHHLTPDATDADIDTAWRAWYSANSQVIGDDPDLIQPGQLLLPPDPEMGR